jgi:hypothetical protein
LIWRTPWGSPMADNSCPAGPRIAHHRSWTSPERRPARVELLDPPCGGSPPPASVGAVGRESRWARRTPLPLAAQSKGALIRLSTPGNCGLRGEGSTPVPLPPPDCPRRVFSGQTHWQLNPVAVAISNLRSGLRAGRTALLFSERPLSLRTSGPTRYGSRNSIVSSYL